MAGTIQNLRKGANYLSAQHLGNTSELRGVGGRCWGPRGEKIIYRKTLDLCKTLLNCWASDGRHNSKLTKRGQLFERRIPPCYRVLFRSKFPANSANFGGSPRANSYIYFHRFRRRRILAAFGDRWRDANSRSDPTFTRASPR